MKSLQLAEVHRAHGALLEEDPRSGLELPRRFGDADAEQSALRDAVGLVDTSWLGIADIRGANVPKVLRGVFASAVTDLAPGAGQPSLLLTAKGRIVALFHLFCVAADRFRVVLTEPLRPEVLRQIERYVTFSDLEVVERTAELAVLALQGPKAGETLARAGWSGELPAAPLCIAEADLAGVPVAAYRGGPTPEGGCCLWVPRPALAEVWDRLADAVRAAGGLLAGEDALDALRIEAGRARYGREYGDDSFPNEVRWQHALTYDKCYVGQEIVARMRTYGDVHRRLKGLRLPCGAAVADGDRVLVGDEETGVITSSRSSARLGAPVALFFLKRKHSTATHAAVETRAGPVAAEIVELPFVARREDWSDPAPDADA